MISMKPIRSVTLALAALLVVAGCSHEDPGDSSAPSPSPSASQDATQAPGDSQGVPGPAATVDVDTSAFRDLPSVEGFSSTQVRDAAETAKQFALTSLTDKDFYSGSWLELDADRIADKFAPHSTESVVDVISDLDSGVPEDMQVLASIAPIFRPTEKTTAPEACEQHASGCVASDVVFSDVNVTVDDEDPRIQVSFKVSTSRLLVHEEQDSHSNIRYDSTYWLVENNEGGWLVDAFNNTYEFGAVTPGTDSVVEEEQEEVGDSE